MPMIFAALLAISFGLWGLTAWWWSVVEILRGLTPIALILFGVIALAVGLSHVRVDREVSDESLLGEEG